MKSDDAIRDAYVSVYPALFRFLRKKLGCASEAADLTQESFARWLDTARNGGPVRAPRAFLFRVARNLMQDSWRKECRHEAALRESRDRQSEPTPSSERMLDSKQRLALLVKAVDELPPKCREAFKLHKFHGLSHAEVALRMGITRNMVEKHVIKAMLHIRDRVAPREDP